MRTRLLAAAGLAVLASVALTAQNGVPNLSGNYSFSTVTPLQRPDALAGKASLTDEEAAAFEADENKPASG